MKKTYRKPELKQIQISLQNIIAESGNQIQIDIDGEQDIDNENSIWSNHESQHSIWE